ncbi:MAG TPA: triose-phosphate isomerase [Polyangia bacterium]|jgi:triosephosphate isomerase (TIM)|nr:triose-phosphate isomerase [Polyangia bacterium]
MARTRRPFFCGNWKLNGSIAESLALATEVRNGVAALRDADVAVAPSFTALYAVAKRLEDGPVMVAAQDCFWDDKGAFTGEVAPSQIADVGCKQVIVGHSERRQLFGELDAAVNLKARAALRVGLTPIICIGETLAERDAGETLGRVQAQLDAALAEMSDDELGRLVIAYEPVWAIGTGRNATPAQAQEVHHFIRTRFATRAAAPAAKLRILYGGSVKPDNVRALMAEPDVDGGLVGGASLSAESFVRIVKEGSGS